MGVRCINKMNSQSSYISKWISLNFDLQYVYEKICDTMLAKPKDAFINIKIEIKNRDSDHYY